MGSLHRSIARLGNRLAAAAGGRPSGPSTRLRRTLRLSTWEGALTEVVNACAGPTILTGWALHLGAPPLEVGLVGALPSLAALVHVPAAWLTSTLGRRRVAIATVALSRQVFLPLALLPLFPAGPAAQRAVLLAVAAASAVLAVAGNNAWTAWMGELVPGGVRGRYFGRRTALCTLGGTLAGLGTARLLDSAAGIGAAGTALAVLAACACVTGAVTTVLMARQHDVPAAPAPAPSLAEALRPLADPRARGFLAYQIAWNAAVGLGGGYFAFHLLHDLRAGFTVLALHGALVAALKIASTPLWGRALDRLGSRPVLAACSFAIGFLPLVWLVPRQGFLWPFALDAVVGGIAWGGHALASFAAPLAIAPRRGRPFWLAAFSTAGGVAAAAATALGGALAGALPERFAAFGRTWWAVDALFLASAAGRLAAAFLAMHVAEPGASTLGELHRRAMGAVGTALALGGIRVAEVAPRLGAAAAARRSRARAA